MFGIGTLLNTGAVILGGILGLLFKNGVKDKMQETLMHACGISTIFIGVAGALTKMFVIGEGSIETQGTMLIILSLVIGGLLGEVINLEKRMDTLGEKIKKLVHREKDNKFVDGFVNVSLIICVGAMAIVGSIEDGVSGDFSMLAVKAVLDGIIVMIFASSYGVGAIFSALPILVYQGSITVLAHIFGAFASEQLINNLSMVGSILIFCVGVNIAFGKKFRVGNLLPALLGPVVYEIALAIIKAF